jgi:hypothetical protein
VLLFSIFAMVSGANSYRGICTYAKVHRKELNKAFEIRWKRPPAHTAIRYILQGLSAADVEKAFREHAADLNLAPARQVLTAFAVDTGAASRTISCAATNPTRSLKTASPPLSAASNRCSR